MCWKPCGPSFVRKKRSHEKNPYFAEVPYAQTPARPTATVVRRSRTRAKPFGELTWETAEGIGVHPLYTAADPPD